jgi:undecaprenyl-diphosphatase
VTASLRAALVLSLLGSWLELDAGIVRALQERRAPWMDSAMNTVTRVGSPVTVLGALLALAVAAPPAGVTTARLALVSLAGANLAVEGLKWSVGRARPDGSTSRSNSSFPSSHAANAYCLALLLARRWPRAEWAWWLAAAALAFSRVYLNRHYPSDVLAGAALGAGVAALVLRRGETLLERWPGRPRKDAS